MTYLPPDPQNPAAAGPLAPQMPPGAPAPYLGQPEQYPVAQPPYQGDTVQYPGAQPQYPGQPPYGGAPVPPGQPPKRGLPAWAWVVLSIVAALFIGIIIALAVFIPRMVNEFSAAQEPVPTQPAPAPTEEPDLDDSAAGTQFTLDDEVTLAAGPFWGVEFDDDWQIEIWDTEGVNQLSHAESGCKLYTFQAPGVPDAASSATDRAATELTIPVAIGMGLPWDASGDPEVKPDGSLDTTLDFGPDRVEMAQLRAEYTGASGEARERVMILRAFLPANNVLLAQVDCPAGAPELTDRLEDLSISQY